MKEHVVRPLRKLVKLWHAKSNLMPSLAITFIRSLAAAIPLATIAVGPPALQASPLTYYPDRASFNAAQPGLPVETFQEASFAGNCYPSSVFCYGFQPSSLNSSTNYAFFPTGLANNGIAVTTLLPETPGNQNLLVLNGGAVKVGGTKSVGTNNFGDTLVLKFSSGMSAVAADIFACCENQTPPVSTDAGNFSVSFYNGTTLLDSIGVTESAGAFGFFGASSTIPITSIQILYTTNEAVTGVDNIAFGGSSPVPVPEPATVTFALAPVLFVARRLMLFRKG